MSDDDQPIDEPLPTFLGMISARQGSEPDIDYDGPRYRYRVDPREMHPNNARELRPGSWRTGRRFWRDGELVTEITSDREVVVDNRLRDGIATAIASQAAAAVKR